MTRAHVAVYRATDGRVGGRYRIGSAFRKSVPTCLLTTMGRSSGRLRTVPLVYLPDGDRVIVAASYAGTPVHPQWYRNLVAEPRVLVRTGPWLRSMRARTADKAEREELWPRLVELYAEYEEYQSWTEREIPVVVCEPSLR
ncbi:nitroreductase family deazaflavin-dependent oxidoreductase [Streptomyces sp. T-3]|nr:nitroreductase family deazaflavin-dependent oxidoreductase [Streptomyces sp. T-3]